MTPLDGDREAKTCIGCQQSKSLDSFPIDRKMKGGRGGRCKVCTNEAARAWRAARPEVVAQRNEARRNAPSDVVDARNAARRAAYAEDETLRERLRSQAQAWREANPDKVEAQKVRDRENHVHDPNASRQRWLRAYGLTQEKYEELVALQDGRCAVCDRACARYGARLPIDHNHDTGRVRGLVCDNCNKALGLFNDDVGLLLAAASYLRAGGVIPEDRYVARPNSLRSRNRRPKP